VSDAQPRDATEFVAQANPFDTPMTFPGMKQRLQKGETLAGYMATIPSAVSVQAMAAAGADWIVIDQEHGAVGPESLHAMIAATAGTPCAPLVRVPKRDEA
jgi:4-hydroxy-2-oxoheptanedioate aldolase